jgi:hypothetical protein
VLVLGIAGLTPLGFFAFVATGIVLVWASVALAMQAGRRRNRPRDLILSLGLPVSVRSVVQSDHARNSWGVCSMRPAETSQSRNGSAPLEPERAIARCACSGALTRDKRSVA